MPQIATEWASRESGAEGQKRSLGLSEKRERADFDALTPAAH
jgi:hypothetical protein